MTYYWFAKDMEGFVAVFEASDRASLPKARRMCADREVVFDLWVDTIAPWIARHVGLAETYFSTESEWNFEGEELYGLFDSSENAKAACAAVQGRAVTTNRRLLSIAGEDWRSILEAEGLIGFSPTSHEALHECPGLLVHYHSVPSSVGLYRRVHGGVLRGDSKLDADPLPLRFADSKEVNLVDHFQREELELPEGGSGEPLTVTERAVNTSLHSLQPLGRLAQLMGSKYAFYGLLIVLAAGFTFSHCSQ